MEGLAPKRATSSRRRSRATGTLTLPMLRPSTADGCPVASSPMGDAIVDVDLLAFESGDRPARRAVVDGVLRSLRTGFVYTSHDIPDGLLDDAYGMLAAFFHIPVEVKQRYAAPESHGQTGYTGLLVETAAGADDADWKEMLNWSEDVPASHPLRRKYPHRHAEQVLPEADVRG